MKKVAVKDITIQTFDRDMPLRKYFLSRELTVENLEDKVEELQEDILRLQNYLIGVIVALIILTLICIYNFI